MYTKILYSYNVCFSTSLFKNISEFPKAQFYLAHVYRFCSKVSQNTSKNAWRTTSMSRCFCFESLLMKLHNGKTMDLCLPAFVQSLSNSSKLHHSKDMSVRLCSEFFSKCFKMKRCLSCVCLPVRAPRNIKIVNQPQNVSFSLLKNLLKIFSKSSQNHPSDGRCLFPSVRRSQKNLPSSMFVPCSKICSKSSQMRNL
jgi:hypothetical protein